ncbi:MAG: DUF4129 domain-containing protein [Deltaproteobacteria bacterium]|nr:DUF4129 domain-containing protein [Deltaproteobacteria bacterium]
MKSRKGSLLFLAVAGMELSWLYAWATFIIASILHRPFPLPEAIGTFALAALLTLVVRGSGWRVILILGLQVFGLLLATSRIVHVFFYESNPFFDQWWLLACFRQPKDPLQWFILVIILFFALLFWVGGVTLARRSAAYLTVCTRFDLGVTAFFCLLLAKFLLLVKGGIDIQDSTPELLLFPFFIFSLLAIGMARNQSSAQRDFLSGYQGIGVIVTFTVVVLAFSGGLILLFLPYLSTAAEMGYGVLRSAAAPLSPILVAILRFLFMHSRSRLETASPSSGSDEAEFVSSTESSWWTELFEKIFSWGFLGLGVLIAFILCGLGMWYLFKWLFSRTTKSEKRQIQWSLISLWASQLWSGLIHCWNKIVRRVKGYRSAVQLYNALLNWGRHSGLPHFLSETPTEYGVRLRHQFPTLKREIGLIVEALNKEVYGEIVLDEQQFTMAKLAWRRLRSPIHWPSRFKSWFLQPGV